jgi:AraC family transcriptional regulator of arabinose operon
MDARVAAIIARMHAEIGQPLPVASLAAGVELSASRLIHLFTAETGVSPARYLRGLRLQRAHAELAETGLRVREVMARAGFTNASHFSRAFKGHYGLSPRALRGRRSRGEPERGPGQPQELSPDETVGAGVER